MRLFQPPKGKLYFSPSALLEEKIVSSSDGVERLTAPALKNAYSLLHAFFVKIKKSIQNNNAELIKSITGVNREK